MSILHNFSAAADRNKNHIFKFLAKYLKGDDKILEIGSCSGQHGLFFAQMFPNICWQFSDILKYMPDLLDNIRNSDLKNLMEPFELEVMSYDWSRAKYDIIYTANTLHIMNDIQVDCFLNNLGHSLRKYGKLIIYGPFNYNNVYTSESNYNFDLMLRSRKMGSYIKSFEKINETLKTNGFNLIEDIAMPKNNRILIWSY